MTQEIEFYLNSLKSSTGGIKSISVAPFALTEPFLDLASRFSEEPGTVVLMSGGIWTVPDTISWPSVPGLL